MDAEDFHKVEINKWSDLEEIASDKSKKWIYRGQRESEWTFKSSLERLCNSMDINLKDAHLIEKTISSEFKRRFHQYSSYLPNYNDNLEWLSIMRHHMAPTRLLDWNYSIFIALYFALERECNKDHSTVWCLNSDWAANESKNYFLGHCKEKKDVENICDKPSYMQNSGSFTNLFLREPFIDTAFPISPRNITQRITVQKGLFLCPGNPQHKFDENIEKMNGFKDKNNIFRLLISKKKRKEYLSRLFNINITHATLFPGLDGFAYSLSVYHQSFEKGNIRNSQFRNDDSVWDLI